MLALQSNASHLIIDGNQIAFNTLNFSAVSATQLVITYASNDALFQKGMYDLSEITIDGNAPANTAAFLAWTDINAYASSGEALNITDATRPENPPVGIQYYNTDSDAFEFFDGATWSEVDVTSFATPGLPASITTTPANNALTVAAGTTTGAATYEAQAALLNTFTALAGTASGSSSLSITGLTNGTAYYTRIRGISARGVKGAWKTSVGTAAPSAAPPAYDYTSWAAKTIFRICDSIGVGTGIVTGGASTPDATKTWQHKLCVAIGAGIAEIDSASGKVLESVAVNTWSIANTPNYNAAIHNAITIALGVNDYHSASWDICTPEGFIADYITKVQDARDKGWPADRILIVGPYAVLASSMVTGEAARFARYCDAALWVAQYFGCCYLDANAVIDAAAGGNYAQYYVIDGIHPIEAWQQLIADYLINSYQWIPESVNARVLGKRIPFSTIQVVTGRPYPADNGLGYIVGDGIAAGYDTNYAKGDYHFPGAGTTFFAMRIDTSMAGFVGVHPSSVLNTGGIQAAMNISSILIITGNILSVNHNGSTPGGANAVTTSAAQTGKFIVFEINAATGDLKLYSAINCYDNSTWTLLDTMYENYTAILAYIYINLYGTTDKIAVPIEFGLA